MISRKIQVPFRDRKAAIEYCNRLLAKGYDAKVTEVRNERNELIWEVYAVPTIHMRRALRP